MLLPLITVGWLHIAVVMALELITGALAGTRVYGVRQICSLSTPGSPPPSALLLLAPLDPQRCFSCFTLIPKRTLAIERGPLALEGTAAHSAFKSPEVAVSTKHLRGPGAWYMWQARTVVKHGKVQESRADGEERAV